MENIEKAMRRKAAEDKLCQLSLLGRGDILLYPKFVCKIEKIGRLTLA